MKLRQRLGLHYSSVAFVAIVLLAGLGYHEFQTEVRLRAALPPDRQAEAGTGDTVELFVYALIPVILLTGWWTTRESLGPLTELARRVAGLDVESLRLPIARTGNGDEVDRLAGAFNTMAARLDGSFRQVREFTLHASHELKTPLTVMRAELERVLGRSDASPELKESLHSVSEEIDRLTRIVDALTLLTKADAGLVTLERAPVGLADLVRESAEDARILGEPYQVAVTLEECADVTVNGDRHRLRQLMLNLVDNATKYNVRGGRVVLSLRRAGPLAEIAVRNTGDLIPETLRPRVFDRFMRGEEARPRSAEGCGLGLAIAQWIVHAHGGTIALSSSEATTTALVRLPLAAI
jgi:signal transduction histidine kinase